MIWPQKDRISFDIPFHIAGGAPPLCFALFRKKLESMMLDNFKDLKLMCKKFKVEGLSDKFTLLTDHQEMIPWFFDGKMKEFVRANEKGLESIQVSDRQTFFKTYI